MLRLIQFCFFFLFAVNCFMFVGEEKIHAARDEELRAVTDQVDRELSKERVEPPIEECTFAPGRPRTAIKYLRVWQRSSHSMSLFLRKISPFFGLTSLFSLWPACFCCITSNPCHWKESDVMQLYHHPIWYISWSIIWSNLSPKELYVLDPIRPDSATTKNAILSAKCQEVYLRCYGRTREVGGATRGRCKCVHIWAIFLGLFAGEHFCTCCYCEGSSAPGSSHSTHLVSAAVMA